MLLCLTAIAQRKTTPITLSPVLIKETSTPKPMGFFLSDSIGIGLKVAYSLSYTHKTNETVLFPDTSYNFAPFELIEKKYYPTITQKNLSKDSVIYYLTTFETDKIQSLSLPIYLVEAKDSLRIFAEKDSVFLQELVKSKPDNLPLKENTRYILSEELFDYPIFFTFLVGLLLLLLVIWFFLGARLRRTLLLYQFRLRHNRFLRDFTKVTNQITEKKSAEDIEKAISLWKKHLEYIEEKPFSTYTSKEIAQFIPDNRLSTSLKSIDKAIYGKVLSEEIESSLQFLKSFSIFRFERRQETLRTGLKEKNI